MEIINFQCENHNFDESSFDDENNISETIFTKIQCPNKKCNNILTNITWFDFDIIKNEDFIDLFMLDNNLDELNYIIKCPVCKKYIFIDIIESTNKKLIVRILKTPKI